MTDDEYDASICSACNGSGEGQHETTRCYRCHGKGVIKPGQDDLDEPDDYSDRYY